MSNKTKARIFKIAAIVIDILAPVIATATQFPVWIHKSSGATLSGLFIIIAIICVIPAFKAIAKHINTPGMPIVWGVLFVILFALARIIEEMLIVCIVGIVSNLIGAGLYLYGEKIANKEPKIKEEREVANNGEVE